MKTSLELEEDMHKINRMKLNLIKTYVAAQESSQIPLTQKLKNTELIYSELRSLNDLLTNVECEYVALLCYKL